MRKGAGKGLRLQTVERVMDCVDCVETSDGRK